MQKTNLQLPGSKAGRINWEIRIDRYTLLNIKQITNKNLLYSTGNSTQDSTMAYMEKESKKRVDTCITDSLCCTLDTNTTLQSFNFAIIIYCNLKKKKTPTFFFPSNCIILYIHQQCMRDPVAPRLQYFWHFFMLAILTGMQYHLMRVDSLEKTLMLGGIGGGKIRG